MKIVDMQATGEHLSELMEARNVSRKDIHEELGCSYAAICTWVQGNRIPRAAILTNLADMLGVTMDDILVTRETEGKA